MMVVLVIIALVAAAAIPAVSGLAGVERLRSPLRDLARYAKTAHMESISRHCVYEILIEPHSFLLQPSAPLDSTPDNSEDPEAEAPITERLDLDESLVVELKRFGDVKWHEVKGMERWSFQPGGLCEPLSIRVRSGESYLEHTYNPVTARVQEEKLYAP
jgi:hypothetical protein